VLRWNTRVAAFVYSLTDRYPPFSLQPDAGYPIDVAIERPPRHSRLYALFTLLAEALALVAIVWLTLWLVNNPAPFGPEGANGASGSWNGALNWGSGGQSILILRVLAAVPHLIIVAVLSFIAFLIWIVVQWVILIVAYYPRGLYDLVVGIVRWQTRVTAYTLGLLDRYPPFTFDPSLTVNAGPPPALPGARPPLPPGGPPPPLGTRPPVPPPPPRG
jgi:hypothetical protein